MSYADWRNTYGDGILLDMDEPILCEHLEWFWAWNRVQYRPSLVSQVALLLGLAAMGLASVGLVLALFALLGVRV